MSYQVLARKWRPRDFSELVGQESTVKTLCNALSSGRLHHAYLFTGTRGVGKTTIARILAKAFNCETGVTATPCGQCSNCTAIDKGNFIDLIEIDAASRTKIEDTRELLDNVQFLPSRGKFKIYLIDEVHMLSRHSFNALLKTLEEPPEHSKFFLATTDPKKLPATILSRCLKFNLKKISPDKINQHLQYLLKKENIEGEVRATSLLSHYAEGSLRDALSLLDQAIAHGNGQVSEDSVRNMLGISDKGVLLGLMKYLIEHDAAAALQYLQSFDTSGGDFHSLLAEMLCLLHAIAIEQTAPGTFENTRLEASDTAALSRQISKEDVQLYYQIALKGKADIDYAPTPKAGMEMVILRMFLFSDNQSIDKISEKKTSRQTQAPLQDKKNIEKSVSHNEEITADISEKNWPSLVKKLNVSGITRQLASHSRIKEYNDHHLTLEISKTHAPLLSEDSKKKFHLALKETLGTALTLSISTDHGVEDTPANIDKKKQLETLSQAQQAFENDPVVQRIQKKFGGEIVKNTIKSNL